jgi:hypothetical protein
LERGLAGVVKSNNGSFGKQAGNVFDECMTIVGSHHRGIIELHHVGILWGRFPRSSEIDFRLLKRRIRRIETHDIYLSPYAYISQALHTT